MTGQLQSRPRTPSVAELQAALLAAQRGDFADMGSAHPAAGRPASVPQTPPGSALRGERPTRHIPPDRPPSPGTGVTLLGSHGGSGASSLAAVLPGAELTDKAYPCTAARPVVLVCRATHRGLTSAQDHAREHRDGDCGDGQPLLGLVVVAAAPGRTPCALRRLEQLVGGAVPVLGNVPWVEQWRVGPARRWQPEPDWLSTLAAAINAARSSVPA